MDSVSRSQFFAMNWIQQQSHLRSGGTVVNDPPTVDHYEDLKSIVDGKTRWAAYTARQKALGLETAKASVVAQEPSVPVDGAMTRAAAYQHLRTGGSRDGVSAEHLADWDRTVRLVG
jgi:hypothetical protein